MTEEPRPRFLKNETLHVPGPPRDLIGYGASPPLFSWPSGAGVAVQVVINYEEGSEASWPMGDGMNDRPVEMGSNVPPGTRDLATETMYEYGSRVGVWRLLRLVEEFSIPVTFFATAVAIELNPAVGKAIVAGGHEVCSHGYRWLHQFGMTRDEERQAIRLTVASFERACGQRPVGWYCRYGPSVNVRELLVEEGGFLYDSDAYNDDLPYYVRVGGKPHMVIPYCLDANDGRFVSGAFGSGAEFCQYLTDSFNCLAREARQTGGGRMLSIGLHPRFIGRPGRVEGLRRFLAYAKDAGAWFTRRDAIARFWLERFPPS